MLLVVAMFVLAGGAVVAAAPVARASTVFAFRTHDAFLFTAVVYHNSGRCGGGNMTARAENPATQRAGSFVDRCSTVTILSLVVQMRTMTAARVFGMRKTI